MEFPILTMQGDYMPGTPNTIGTLARVSKATAKRIYDAAYPLIIVPHKMMPYTQSPDSLAMTIKTDKLARHSDFEAVSNSFQFANCSSEVGYYPAYYVRFHSYQEHPCYSGKFRAML